MLSGLSASVGLHAHAALGIHMCASAGTGQLGLLLFFLLLLGHHVSAYYKRIRLSMITITCSCRSNPRPHPDNHIKNRTDPTDASMRFSKTWLLLGWLIRKSQRCEGSRRRVGGGVLTQARLGCAVAAVRLVPALPAARQLAHGACIRAGTVTMADQPWLTSLDGRLRRARRGSAPLCWR